VRTHYNNIHLYCKINKTAVVLFADGNACRPVPISTGRLETVVIIILYERIIISQSLKQYFYLAAAAAVSVLTSLPLHAAPLDLYAAATADTAAAVIDTRGNAAAAAAATTAEVRV